MQILALTLNVFFGLLLTVQSFIPSFKHSKLLHDLSSLRKSFPMSMTEDPVVATQEPMPGNPILKTVDKQTNVAFLSVAVPGTATQEAFTKSCDAFNEEVKSRGYKVPGFRPGSKLPPQYLYQIFGEDKVKMLCGNLLTESIQDECEKTGLMFVGRGRITNFFVEKFTPGQPHALEIECDLWPEISYEPSYKGLVITVSQDAADLEKINKVKKSIRERYKVKGSPQPMGYAAQMADLLTVNMKGFDAETNAPLPTNAQGDQLEINMEEGKYMPGMVEGLVGAQVGETKKITVTFPTRANGPGAELSGKQAIFEIEVLSICKQELPEWNAELAKRVRPDLTLEQLEKEVKQAVEGEATSTTENLRNEGLANALLERMRINKLPESLMEENTQMKFEQMIMDFKQQGSTDEQLQEMLKPEQYQRYKEISKPNVEKIVKLGMAFRDIAEKEKIEITDKEIQEQIDMINAQAKQRNEAPPDLRRARDEIENVLLRKKVFGFLADNAEITYVDVEPVAPQDTA